jgi:winged helix DNA-binding protein
VAGIQAQEGNAARLGFRARSRNLTARDVDRARTEERSIVRVWVMRKTLHLIAADDAAWMLPLFEPGIEAWSRRRLGQLGMADGQVERSMKEIGTLLAPGEPVSRAEVVDALAAKGVELTQQLRTHVFVTAVTSGLAAFGPDAQKGQPALIKREAWLGKAPRFDRGRSLAELARRYFGAFGPATEADFAGWAGLTLGELRAGMGAIGGELREVEISGERGWMLGRGRRAPAGPVVRLLPGWDNYLMGWRDRSFLAPRERWEKIGIGGGMLLPSVMRDGVAVGLWRLRRTSGRASVEIRPFQRLDAATRARIDEEIEDVARFEGLRLV